MAENQLETKRKGEKGKKKETLEPGAERLQMCSSAHLLHWSDSLVFESVTEQIFCFQLQPVADTDLCQYPLCVIMTALCGCASVGWSGRLGCVRTCPGGSSELPLVTAIRTAPPLGDGGVRRFKKLKLNEDVETVIRKSRFVPYQCLYLLYV